MSSPPLSALIVAFDGVYDLSLLANTLSDEGFYTMLIVPDYAADDLYNNFIDVEVLQLSVNIDKSARSETRALETCDSFFTDQKVLKQIREFQPTVVIFPALRHDGCLLPFVKYIDSIPVIWMGNPDEELYVFECTGAALPIHNGGFWSRLSTSFAGKFIFSNAKNNYLIPALQLAKKHLPDTHIDLDHLYADVRLLLWGVDTVLRSNFAPLTQSLIEIGCHHCRGPHPLPGDLHKLLIEYRMGTVIVLLDENYETLISELVKVLPQRKMGQAIVWSVKAKAVDTLRENINIPKNLFIHSGIDRQDLIGYSRTRMVLSHCGDTEFLEAAFHGTPMICLPRDTHESRNAARAIELGFARSIEATGNYISDAEEIANIVDEIHSREAITYRERAQKVSMAIRDRLNPSSDRLMYWLRYIARTKDSSERFHKVKNQARTLMEDIQFFVGLLVGIIFGIICTGSAVVARYLIRANRVQRSKGRYTQ
ncbi:hypothetical protein HN011_010077 [Eciton burchellii]|nr:hypothetical protein HN011_010077 [Eciton burchellii]